MISDDRLSISERQSMRAYGTSSETEGKQYRRAHKDSDGFVGEKYRDREDREAKFNESLAPGATPSVGAGDRVIQEEPDPERLCHEVDYHRVVHSGSFRRLAGKTQVVVQAPATAAGVGGTDAHLRNRLTHALEVAQVGESVALAVGLNHVLTRAMCVAHDLGHGPFGHASEDALSVFAPDGIHDHAVWGSDVVAEPLNLCLETLDAIRNHSWKRPAPFTPEGEVTSWADRIAYLCHDFDDATHSGLLSPKELPKLVREHAGLSKGKQLKYFIRALIEGTSESGYVSMSEDAAEVLDEFRKFNYERLYLRDEAVRHDQLGVDLLRALVEYYIDAPGQIAAVIAHPELFPENHEERVKTAVRYVASMTDQFAMSTAITVLGWDLTKLPR